MDNQNNNLQNDLARESSLSLQQRLHKADKNDLILMLLKIYDVAGWTSAGETPDGEFAVFQVQEIELAFEDTGEMTGVSPLLEIKNTPSEIKVARVNAVLEDGTQKNEMIHVYIDQDGVRNTACISFDTVDEFIGILIEAKSQSFPDRSDIN
jgi:hypothetical protein